MGYCSVSDTRRRFSEAFGNRAYPANVKVLEQIIAVRDQFAQVLGFASYAAYEISGEMAGSPERVDRFLEQLIKQATKKAGQEVAEIKKDLPEGIELDKQGRFNSWDYGYVHSQYKKKHFKLDQREVAEYFPVDKALQGMLDIYQKLLSLTFKVLKPAWAWHDEVSVLEVSSSKTGFLLGYIALDLYPRANKYNHACCGGLEFPVLNKEAVSFGGRQPGLAIVVANFPRATSDKPALFKHADVETFFHEFGHAMHCLLGATRMHTHAGYQTKVDFVELPSQIFEEWLFDRDLLKNLSSHYQTGEPLPDHLIDALLNLKQFNSGEMVLGQVRNAYMSLHYFGPGQHKDSSAIRNELSARLMPHIVPNPATHGQAAFGHLGSYGSRYYGYLWSKVFALDVFYQLRPKGLTNPATGDWFVSEILGKGGSVDPNEMLRSFLGREPKIDAFFDDLGLN
jgi:thimet oligopeptidase